MGAVFLNSGKAIITARLKGLGTEPNYIAWGTGAGTTAATDATLFTESTDEARVAGTSSQVTTTTTNDTYQVTGTLTVATAGKTITNVGLFDSATHGAGNGFLKADFTGIALGVGESIAFTLKQVNA